MESLFFLTVSVSLSMASPTEKGDMKFAFVLMLFAPMIWRFVLALLGLREIRSKRDIAILCAVPLLVAAILLRIAWGLRSDGIFIPLMLIVFWSPQIAGLAFFVWCDLDGSNRS